MNPRENPSKRPSDEPNERLEALAERVDRLEDRVGLSTTTSGGTRVSLEQLLALGLTRRQAIAALGFVAAGATISGAITRAVETVQMADDEETTDTGEGYLEVQSVRVADSVSVGQFAWEIGEENGEDVLTLAYEP